MAEFAYNNAKNASSGHMPLKLNYGYQLWMFYKKNINLCSKSKSAEKLLAKLREQMIVCQKNLYYAPKLQKRAYNKGVKPRSYVSNNKVWLNSKYIKIKQNRKLKARFFRPFKILHLVGKQVYKLQLFKKWKIHDVFYMSLLK